MSPLAILRRQSKRAMRQLMKRGGYRESSFEIPSTRDNSLDVLPGTPIYWTPPSYYEGESDCLTALDEYRQLVVTEKIDWSGLHRQDYLRERYAMMRTIPELFRLEAAQ